MESTRGEPIMEFYYKGEHQSRLEMTNSDKHPSLPLLSITYGF